MLIGEVASRSGVSARMLRHYDTIGLVSPSGRTSGGYRDYTDEDLDRLSKVEGLRALGLSLAEVGHALGGGQLTGLVQQLIRHTRERIVVEQELLTRLEHVEAAGPADWDEVLRVVETLRGLESEFAAYRQRAVLEHIRSGETAATLPIPALVSAVLHEDDLNIVGALHWALARSDDVVAVVDGLSAALADDDVGVRGRAVGALCELEIPEATESLIRVLDDPDDAIRERVALTVGRRGVAQATPVLVDMIRCGSGDVAAAEVLGALADSVVPGDQIVNDLRAATDATPPAQLRLVQALAEIPGTAAIADLRALVDHADRHVALTAAAVLNSRNL